MRKPILDTLIIAGLATLLATVYRGATLAYIETLQVPDYSYLMVLVPSVIYIVADIIDKHAKIQELDIARVLAATGGLLVAFSLHNLSQVIVDNSLELELLSIVTLLASILFLVYGDFKNPIIPFITWILLLLLIPIPRGVIDTLSARLTKPVAEISSTLTGAQLTEAYGFTSLKFIDSQGIQRIFQIAPECSGVVSLLSALSLTPIIAYVALTSNAKVSKKIATIILAIALATIVVFAGNILRVSLVVYVAKTHDYQSALRLFHQTPSIIYAGIATIVALTITLRLPRAKTNTQKSNKLGLNGKITGGDIIKALFITLIVLSTILLSTTQATITLNQPLPMPEQLIQSPTTILYNQTTTTNATITLPSPLVGEALGALAVYRTMVTVDNKTLSGWIEVAETPARFHSWFVCLSAQKYQVIRHWTEPFNKTTITYILYKKGGILQLLAYTIVKYPTQEGPLYVKVSLFTQANKQDYLERAELLRKALMEMNIPSKAGEALKSYFRELYLGLILLITALVISPIYKLYGARMKRVYTRETLWER